MSTTPLAFRWTGDSFVPHNAYVQKRADQAYVIGEVYLLVEQQERSSESHRHYFASIKEGWENLPENIAAEFPTPEHLRKRALIKAGYYDSHSIVCSSKAEALRLAAFIRPLDEYGVVRVDGAVVTRYTAKSQSMRAMGKREFQASKEKVLDVIASMIEVSRDELQRNAGRAA
ncbi:hypothetical protein [Chelativorans sp. AA-79]|uniref:hypothetical protein n=1 Tax=Chelativorans sp. AA-79 TaxID=3028735 RepID=UPI0023F9B5DD|nr:hypothetical protein [Chelativorans sp. AA-79]WEX10337.1 hypothetical protein PVE73_05085 [Chelativorans sp. AA-79]